MDLSTEFRARAAVRSSCLAVWVPRLREGRRVPRLGRGVIVGVVARATKRLASELGRGQRNGWHQLR